MARGVAMNCVSIGKVIGNGLFEEVYVPPAPGDSGTAVGAGPCRLPGRHRSPGGRPGRVVLPRPPYPGLHPRGPARHAREGRSPTRPGSLRPNSPRARSPGACPGPAGNRPADRGNRSTLASPLVPDVAARLNAAVKFREPFRPFAPVVLTDHAAGDFDLAQPSPFMSVAVPVTGLARDTIPAVVHANGTARVQALDPEHNPFLADVLACFAVLMGVPVLINTSLNVKGKPISGTPQMALDCLAASGLDGLMLSAVDVKSARQAFADPCRGSSVVAAPVRGRPVQSRRSRAPLPGPDSRPRCVRHPRTQRHPPTQGGTPRHRAKTAR